MAAGNASRDLGAKDGDGQLVCSGYSGGQWDTYLEFDGNKNKLSLELPPSSPPIPRLGKPIISRNE